METRGRFRGRVNKDEANLDNIETHYTNMNATMKSLEMQLDQLTNEIKNQSKGKFPSNTEQNPRDQCKAIILQRGKEVELSKPKEVKGKEIEAEVEVEEEAPRVAPKPNSISFPDNPPIISLPLPFP